MKKSGHVGLALIAALGIASCGRPAPVASSAPGTMNWGDKPRDPCSPEHFEDATCRSAVDNRGYHYGGLWYPMLYSRGYGHYYDSHRSFLSSGGRHAPPPAAMYRPGGPSISRAPGAAPSGSSTARGGFGSSSSSSAASAGS